MITRWIQDYRALPKSFTLQERLDRQALENAIKNPHVHREQAESCKGLIKRLDTSDTIAISYTRREYGRYFPDSFCSTYMWRNIRWEAVPKEVTDLDAVSCFPNIVLHLCGIHGVSPNEYSHIQKYAADRSHYIDSLEITDDMLKTCNTFLADNLTKAELGKRFFNMFCFGAGKNAFKRELGLDKSPFPVKGLSAEFRKQWNRCKTIISSHADYADIIVYLKNKKNSKYHNGCALSVICQSFEALTVYRLMKAFQNKFTVRSYEYDGLNIEASPEEINDALEDFCGGLDIPIPFKIKERGTPLSAVQFNHDLTVAPPSYKLNDNPSDRDIADLVLSQHKNDLLCINNSIYVRDGNVFRCCDSAKDPYLNHLIGRLEIPGDKKPNANTSRHDG